MKRQRAVGSGQRAAPGTAANAYSSRIVTVTSVDGCQANQPRIKATLESFSHLFLVDTGSSVSFLPVGLVQNDVQACVMPISLQTVAGTLIRVHGEVAREIRYDGYERFRIKCVPSEVHYC